MIHSYSKNHMYYKRKYSAFCIVCFISFLITTVAIFVYFLISKAGYIKNLKDLMANTDSVLGGVVFAIAMIILTGYVGISLYLLFSRKSEEDSRWLSLPIILTPIFLIVSNGLLHLFYNKNDPNFYGIIMDVFVATAICVDTFASLKFSFQMSAQRSRFNESAKYKPDINIINNNGCYEMRLERNSCFMCGIFIGKIDRFYYRDIKKLGYSFFIDRLIFPNVKYQYFPDETKSKPQMLNISKILESCDSQETIEDVVHYAEIKGRDIYLIFRDTQNFYYLALLPKVGSDDYDVIDANENVMSRLLYIYNEKQSKIKRGTKVQENGKTINFTCMSIFKIPFNFYPSKTLDD